MRALERLGLKIKPVTHTAIGGNDKGYPDLSISFRLAWKIGIHIDTEKVNRILPIEAKTFTPDLVWIEKGNMIKPATIKRMKAASPNAVIVSYSEDDMFNELNRTRAFTAGLAHYDIVFTTKSHNTNPDELKALGARRCIMVDKAFDPDQHYPVDITHDELNAYGSDIGFIGSYARERGEDVMMLAKNGFQVRVWGNGWNSFMETHPNLKVERRALVNTDGDLLYSKAIAATRINLGFLRKANRDLQTDRSIEIPACGGFMLAEYSTEHARLFENGLEAVFYRNRDEMMKKARYFLEHESERQTIAAASRERCVNSGYTHDERLRFMLSQALGKPF
tara:strand:- start:211 stop:1218 length:1008 start_codon:yes stop_codon:yes gene_type:complete